MITVGGIDWAVTRKLREALKGAPENGRFVFGVSHCNNLEQLERFRAARVPCPDFTTDYKQAQAWLAEGHTVFGRKLYHTQGKDIIIAAPYRGGVGFTPNWPIHFRTKRDYWVKFVPNVKEEWRIHVFDGRSIARGLKINDGDDTTGLIKNRGHDYHMTHKVEPPEGLRSVAKKAVKALKDYLYGGVDLLLCEDGRVLALEVNAAPAMDNYTRGKYVQAIRGHFAKAR